MRYFNASPSNASRSLQCYLILIGCAARRETITYSQLAEKLGYKKEEGGPGSSGAGVMGAKLGALMFWCRNNDLPALTSIVVNETTGLPGTDITPANAPAVQQDVYRFNWFAFEPPTIKELEAARSLWAFFWKVAERPTGRFRSFERRGRRTPSRQA